MTKLGSLVSNIIFIHTFLFQGGDKHSYVEGDKHCYTRGEEGLVFYVVGGYNDIGK